MAPNLSFETQRRVDMMYPPEQREEVTRLLGLLAETLREQATRILGSETRASTSENERIQFAALKVSNGDVDVLKKAIKLGQFDYRELLIAAGFGWNSSKHKSWLPKGMGPQQEGWWTRRRKRILDSF